MAIRFEVLKNRWVDDTKYLSNMTDILSHSDYKKIIRLGPSVLPLILEDLKDNDNFWFPALQELTGSNPVPEGNEGDMEAMRADWLNWAALNQLI